MINPSTRPRSSPAAVERVESRLLFAAGDPDGSFGAGGIATAPEVTAGAASSSVIDVQATSGRVYLASARFATFGATGNLLVSAFTSSGRLDTSWAGDGTLNTDIDASRGVITVHRRSRGRWQKRELGKSDRYVSHLLPGFELVVATLVAA